MRISCSQKASVEEELLREVSTSTSLRIGGHLAEEALTAKTLARRFLERRPQSSPSSSLCLILEL